MREKEIREEREKDRQRESQKARKKRETGHRRGVDIVATNVTAATVTKPALTLSRPAFEEKRRKERKRERDRKRGKERERRDR